MNNTKTGEYDLTFAFLFGMLLFVIVMLFTIRDRLQRIEETAFIIGCTDSGKVARDVCVAEFKKNQEQK